MKGVIVRHGRRIVETVETGVAPRRRLRGHFIQVPLPWRELLEGASGPANRLALYLVTCNAQRDDSRRWKIASLESRERRFPMQ